MTAVLAAFALREAIRRRVFTVVALLTAGFLTLYGLGVWQVFRSTGDFETGFGVDGDVVVGSTLLGLAIFATLFLGTILAVFLTLGAVRGDADRGLLQPVLVRPVSRARLLVARLVAAVGVCGAYVAAVYVAAVVITGAIGDWWPDRVIGPAAALVLGVAILAALSLAGSVVLASTANGIAVFMVFGAGLVSGLLGQIGDALNSDTLSDVAEVASWLLPFEALYQNALYDLTADTGGLTRFVIQLGPLGGADPGGAVLWLWALAYLGAVMLAARAAFERLDL